MSSSNSSKSEPQILVLDVSPTAAKAFVVNRAGDIVSGSHLPLTISVPSDGFVEQDPTEVLDAVGEVLREAYEHRTGDVVAMGIAVDRESAVAWSRETGKELHPIISWPDRRAYEQCRDIAHTESNQKLVRERSGLKIDYNLPAPKLHWLTNRTETLGSCMGTLDSWLLYNLAEGRPFLTDRTVAAHTGLFNIQTLGWDQDLLKLFGLHEDLLAEVRPSYSDFGALREDVIGKALPIHVMMGDQQASLYAAGVKPGTIEVSYGSRMCAMKVIGDTFQLIDDTNTTLIAGPTDERLYALEDTIGPAASRVLPVINQPDVLTDVLQKLSVEVAASLQPMLTPTDRRIIIDGGISQAAQLPEIQSKVLGGIEVTRQNHFEATAMGVAKLTFDRILQSSLS